MYLKVEWVKLSKFDCIIINIIYIKQDCLHVYMCCLFSHFSIYFFMQDDLIGRLSDNTENAVDTDSRVLDAYINQCTAEAQEGTYMYDQIFRSDLNTSACIHQIIPNNTHIYQWGTGLFHSQHLVTLCKS